MNGNETMKKPSGQIQMVLHKGGEYNIHTGKVEGATEITAEKEVKNLIVDKASELMACRLSPGSHTGLETGGSNDGTYLIDGLQYLAVGVGVLKDPSLAYDRITNPVDTANWDLQNPPEETLAATKLQGELFRKPFTSWTFLNPDGSESTTPTNVLKLVTTYLETEAVGPLTEMGLFGGNASDWDNGTGKDTGYMFNYKTFAVWNKPADSRLSISWLLTF